MFNLAWQLKGPIDGIRDDELPKTPDLIDELPKTPDQIDDLLLK